MQHQDVGQHLAHDARVATADLGVHVHVVAVLQRAHEAVGSLDIDADGASRAADGDGGGGLAGRDEDLARDLLARVQILLQHVAAEAVGRGQHAGQLVVLHDLLLDEIAPRNDVLRRSAGRNVNTCDHHFHARLPFLCGLLHVARVNEHRDDRCDREPACDDQVADAVVHGPSCSRKTGLGRGGSRRTLALLGPSYCHHRREPPRGLAPRSGDPRIWLQTVARAGDPLRIR